MITSLVVMFSTYCSMLLSNVSSYARCLTLFIFPSLSHITTVASYFDFVKNGGSIYIHLNLPSYPFSRSHDINSRLSPSARILLSKSELASLARKLSYICFSKTLNGLDSVTSPCSNPLIMLSAIPKTLLILTVLFSDHVIN